MPIFRLCCLLLLLAFASWAHADDTALFTGVDANYSLQMEKEGRQWKWDGKADDLFKGMAAQGAKGFRVRLWTGDEGPNGKTYATEVVKRALAAGLDPYLVIFLSEDWADLMKQPLPKVWAGLDMDKRAEAVRTYSREVVAHFRKAGLRSHLYEIGNEIDYGIAGVYPSKGAKKNPTALSKSCWPDTVKLILASEAGVREADPEAKFLLHVAHWWDADFCIAFYRFLLDHRVQVDFAGLSYYPSANIGGSLEMEQFGAVATRIFEAIKRPLIVPEVAYPSTADFKGQFSRWKKAAPGYPLTPEGQQRWLADFLAYCAHLPAIDSIYYWSPEWYGEGMWKAFALFDSAGEAKPAWSAFRGERASLPTPKSTVFFELDGGQLRSVPIAEARDRAIPQLRAELAKTGRVNMDYIHAITAAQLVVEGWRVNLRASLMGNIDLLPTDHPPKAVDWKAQLGEVDAKTQKAVIFVRGEATPLLDEVLASANQRGLEVATHPVAADAPLKFGLGFDWQKGPQPE